MWKYRKIPAYLLKSVFLILIIINFSLSQNTILRDSKNNFTNNRNKIFPVCVNDKINNKEFINQAIENTKIYSPETYSLMTSKQFQKGLEKMTYILGDKRTFWAFNWENPSFYQVTAELRATGAIANIWVDTNEIRNGHITQEDINSILNDLEISTPPDSRESTKGILKIDNDYFGSPPNINSAGEKGKGNGMVDFLILDIKDGFDGSGGYVAGYFNPNDQDKDNFYSNRRDMLYIDTYPTIYYNESRDIEMALQTTAHEYQHLIHFNYDPNEIAFINEACSQNAEIFCGYNAFNGVGEMDYFSNTNVYLFQWDNEISDYSRATLWLLYFIEQVGDGLAKAIVQNPSQELNGVISALNQVKATSSFYDLIKNWVIANYLNNKSFNTKYGYSFPINGKPKSQIFNNPNDTLKNITISSLGSDYILFNAQSKNFKFRFSTSSNILNIKMIKIGQNKTDVVDINFGQDYTESEFATNYENLVFVITNTSNTYLGQYNLVSSGEIIIKTEEIAYDDGIPRPLDGDPWLYLPYSQSAWAVKFTPKKNLNKLTKAKLWVAFGQELSPPQDPQDVPKRFEFHIWKAKNDSTPGDDLIQPIFFSTNRSNTLPTDFVTIDLSSYGNSLKNITGSIFLGFMEDDEYYTRIAINNSTSKNYSYLKGLPANPSEWIGLDSLGFQGSSGPISLAGWNLMMRAEFWYDVAGVKYVTEEKPDFLLNQNYPNPFNPETKIEYSIVKSSYVILAIYDLLGRTIKNLIGEYQDSGKYIVTWNGEDNYGHKVSTGVYIYRLETGNFSQTKKLNLIK